MSVGELLGSFLIGPLLIICEAVFGDIDSVVDSIGWSVVIFSLVLNVAIMPVYFQMERSGRKGQESRRAMEGEVARMKRHYKGRERYYYIRAVHRQYGYHPISALFTSSDLYLQILVFLTVFQFLSSKDLLSGRGFYLIQDLGQPDGLLFGAHLLPLVMTLLNGISTIYYTQEKSKRHQAFLLAAVFLVLLYYSPSGLVLYWTCNNAFSLVRNAIEKRLLPILPAHLLTEAKQWANQE